MALLESAHGPRTTVQNPIVWPTPGWKRDYMNLHALSPAEIGRRRAENERAREVGKTVRDVTLGR